MRADRLRGRRPAPAGADADGAGRGPRRGSSARPTIGWPAVRASSRAAFGIDTSWTGTDLCDPDRAAAPRARPDDATDDVAPDDRAPTPRVGVDYAGPDWAGRPWRFAIARPPVGLGPARPLRRGATMDASLAGAARVPARPRPPRRRRPRSRRRARLAEALEPSADPVIVARRLDETDQARALLERAARASGSAAPTTSARRSSGRPAAAGSTPEQFLAIADTLDATARLATSLADERRPLLRELGRELASAARRAEHARAQLRPGRRAARHRVAAARRAARRRPRRLRPAAPPARRARRRRSSAAPSRSRSSRCATAATSCPVKAEARSRVKGIVHDASGSGQTLFVEPLVAVELGNAWREAQVAEQEEIARILDELSALVAANARGPARDARRARPVRPVGRQGGPRRRDGRRPGPRPPTGPRSCCCRPAIPGLTGRVVPIDVRLGDGYTALVVTGPNTGGKTVTLRTLGLLSLMHQAGLHVPAAAGSRLPVWRDVFADIGDEQSVAQSLSTFSGPPAARSRAIVDAAGPGTLVLLDELGAGHRPDRGLGARPGAARPLHPGRARSSPPRPTTPSSRPTPTRPPGRATPRSSSTSTRCRRPTG